MFASAGYFRGLNCPYFGSGLCERPYCHFRHVKDSGGKSDEKSGTGHVGTVDGPPTGPTSKIIRTEPVSDDFGFQKSVTSQKTDSVEYNKYTGEPVKCAEQGVNKYTGEVTSANGNSYRGLESLGKDERNLNGIKFNKYTGKPITASPKTEQYSAEYVVSSPVIEINKYTGKPVYGKKVPESVHTGQGSKYGKNMPSYNPTPLTELKKRPMNKYILASSADNGEEEYDPESNYSTLSTSGYKNNQPQLKRAHSYDPSDPSFDVVSKKSKGDFQFDISEFSDDENDEETEEKSRFGEDFEDKDDGFQVKDVQFFEDLLDKKESNEIDEEPGKYFFSSNSEKTESSTSLISKFNSVNNKIQKPSKAFQRSISEKASKEKHSMEEDLKKTFKRSFSTKSASDEKVDSKKSKEKHKVDHLKEKIRSKDKILHKNHKSDSANGHKSSSKLTSSPSKSSDHHKSSSGNHKSSSSTHKSSDTQKSISDNHKSSSSSSHRSSSDSSKSSSHKSSSEGHKSSSSSSQKSSSSHKSSSSSNHKSSSSSHKSSSDRHKSSTSTSSHSGHKSDKENAVKNHEHSKSKRTSSENDSYSKHKERKSSSEDQERRKSVEENAKKKIINLNVDLFGEDSDLEEETEHHNGDIGYSSDSSHGDLISVGSDIELSDNDTYEECFRIFKEGHSRSKDQKKKVAKKKKTLDEDGESGTPTIAAKKRKAHAADIEIRRKLGTDKPVSKLSPAQVMHNRFLQIQQKALKEAAVAAASQAATTKKEAASSSSLSSSLPSCSIVKGKKSSEPRTSTSSTSSKSSEPSKFVMTTVSKTEKRKAHIPDVIKTNLKRPTIPSEFGSKVPVNIRQRYLNLVIDECLKLCSNEEDAYKRGQEEEQAVYQRSNTKKVYLNVVINTIKKLRTEISKKSSSKPTKKTKISPLKIAHEAILGGKSATKTTFTLNRSGGGAKVITENFKGVELFNRLSKYVLTEQQLKDNGFPFPSPDTPGSAIYYTEKGVQMSQKTASHNPIDYEKVCVRCGKRFIVYPNGKYANEEECTYHWGKAWKKRVAGVVDTRYTCCQGDFNSEGCQFAKVHVHETNKFENLSGYMKTIPCSPPPDGDYGIFAMDCEMVYTLAGVELARVTVVDPSNEPIYETLVKPDRKILDYNTKFSGITEEDMKGVTTSIRDVQAVLLSLLTDNTILIGHSLESDLNAVKLIHKTVVDTSVVFPHRLGPPYKRALKTLMAEYMQKIIQDDVGGHDSLEDAVSCMDLMHYKVREDARFEKRS